MKFGEMLAEYRKNANLTLRDFSEKIDYDSSNISKIERGRINPPAGGIILRKWGVVLGLEKGSQKLDDFVAQGLSARIAKTTISDEEIEHLMPAFFRTVDNRRVNPEAYEKLKEILKANI